MDKIKQVTRSRVMSGGIRVKMNNVKLSGPYLGRNLKLKKMCLIQYAACCKYLINVHAYY